MPILQLPESTIGAYTAWVAYCRYVASTISETPALALWASERLARRGDVGSEFLRNKLIPQVEGLTNEAREQGVATLAPLITIDPVTLKHALDTKVRWREALSSKGRDAGLFRALGLDDPTEPVAAIRDGIEATMREAVEARGPGRR